MNIPPPPPPSLPFFSWRVWFFFSPLFFPFSFEHLMEGWKSWAFLFPFLFSPSAPLFPSPSFFFFNLTQGDFSLLHTLFPFPTTKKSGKRLSFFFLFSFHLTFLCLPSPPRVSAMEGFEVPLALPFSSLRGLLSNFLSFFGKEDLDKKGRKNNHHFFSLFFLPSICQGPTFSHPPFLQRTTFVPPSPSPFFSPS